MSDTEHEPEVSNMNNPIETISTTKFRRFGPAISAYSAALGLKPVEGFFSARQHLVRICNFRPEIKAFVRPLGGKVGPEQNARMVRYMIDHPLQGVVVPTNILANKPEKQNPKIARRKLTKAQKKETSSRLKFYDSWDWKKARYQVLQRHGPVCMLCGAERGDTDSAGKPVKICIDHIKPISKFPELRLDQSNLQVLCYDCNKGKGAWDQTDWRKPPSPADEGSILDDEPMSLVEQQLGERMH